MITENFQEAKGVSFGNGNILEGVKYMRKVN